MQKTILVALTSLALIVSGCSDDNNANAPNETTPNNASDNNASDNNASDNNASDNNDGGNNDGGNNDGGNNDDGNNDDGNNDDGNNDDGNNDDGNNDDGNNDGNDDPAIGAPEGDPVDITHEAVVATVSENLAQHIDEIDAGLSMLEESAMVTHIIDMLSDDDEEGDEDSTDDEEEPFTIDLSDIRDGMIDVITERLLAESNATLSDDGKMVTYEVSAETLCVNEDEGERTPEDIQEDLEDYRRCAQRLADNPIVIEATSTGERKLDLHFAIGDNRAEDFRVQLHDDLIAGFVRMQVIESIVGIFVDPEELELPDTMEGQVAGEARRLGASHFALRGAVTEDIRITSDEAEALKFEMAATPAPGAITLDGPAKRIEGELDLDTLRVELPWQEIVNMFYDDEEEVRTECFNNHEDAEACDRVNNDCLAPTFNDQNSCITACDDDLDMTDAQRGECLLACADNYNSSRESCLSQLSGEPRRVTEDLINCIEGVDEGICPPNDYFCRAGHCRGLSPEYSETCDRRDWCEEIREPAPEPPNVNGNLKVFIKAIGGGLVFDGDTDTLSLNDVTLGDETLTVHVEDDPIIGVDLNPDDGRVMNLSLSSAGDDDLRIQVSPLLDVRVALTLHHVWEAFVEEEEDLPSVLADDVLGIRLDGSSSPTIDIIQGEDSTDFRVSQGQLTLSSPNMDDDVVIGEGMCIGGVDEDSLTEEERDAMHDLFGGMQETACGAP